MIDTGVHYYPPEILLEVSAKPRFLQLLEEFDKSILNNVFSTDGVIGIARGNVTCKRIIHPVQLLLCGRLA